MKSALLAALATLLVVPEAPANETVGVDLALLSEVHTVLPGEPFRVGLRIRHHDGYHTYWKNPGIVGMPTRLTWSLPDGFSAGPLQWPTPEVVDMAGHAAHGYRDEVLLVTVITPPAGLSSPSVTLEARVDWMACARTCHPGTATLATQLAVGQASGPSAHQAAFRRFDERRPLPLRGFRAELTTETDTPVIALRLTPLDPHLPPPRNLRFFSDDGQVASDQPQTFRPDGKGGHLLVLRRSEFGPREPAQLTGVLRAGTPLNPDGRTAVLLQATYPRTSGPIP